MKKLNQQGSHVVGIILVIVVLAVIGGIGYKVLGSNNKQADSKPTTSSGTQSGTSKTTWMLTADGYAPSGTPPKCDDRMIAKTPVDLSKVTSMLYPGQYRGPSYKPHGGFRFDTITDNKITVIAPFDGAVIKGVAAYAEGMDDVQYGFDVMNDCGMMYRIGHLYELSSEMKAIAAKLPAPIKNDSRDTTINPSVFVKAGTVIATMVGTPSDHNTFFDFGVIDWNMPNAISSDASWLADPQHNVPLAKHATCWFAELNAKDEATVRALPGNKTSDYCK